jgi:hypothetical protein
MTEVVGKVHVEVLDVDPLRTERLTRTLVRDLGSVAELAISYADTDVRPADGAKGGATTDVLAIATVWGWPLVAPLLAEALKSWLHREKHARVRVTVGADHVEIDGDPTAGQEKLLLALLTRQADE